MYTGFNPGGGKDQVEFTSCSPTDVGVWIDGQRLTGRTGDILALITAKDIEALDVYHRAGLIPAEFQDRSCAAIAMRTR